MIAEKNKKSWNEGAETYSRFNHSEKILGRIFENPANAFHSKTWELLQKYLPDLKGKKICVPSSGDNHAVFAFAMLGAEVTSCDISENQLENAARIARKQEWGSRITFVCADTMKLDGIPDDTFDFVYTSNGVHVWINDLPGMYRNIYRITKPGGLYMLYEIHPFQRPFNDDLTIQKPYDCTGPFESEDEVTFGWRLMDIMNAVFAAGFTVKQLEEMFSEKDYDWPFWIPYRDIAKGVTVPPEEVDRMHDWRNNPMAALPNWFCIAAQK